MITTPKEATQFRNACRTIRAHLPPTDRQAFEDIVVHIVGESLKEMKIK